VKKLTGLPSASNGLTYLLPSSVSKLGSMLIYGRGFSLGTNSACYFSSSILNYGLSLSLIGEAESLGSTKTDARLL
tara:strand:+ start:231 stop:458 length:228 start_codon:yes stop_codon:yes gene_type:complete